MDSYFGEEALNCINEFINLMHSNNYISLKTYNAFLDKYEKIFELNNKFNTNKYLNDKIDYINNKGHLVLEDHNNKWINKELLKNQNFLNTMFDKIDPNIKLDDEQKKAIVCDEDYSLVIAGAGSGKTTTMAAKVNYLVNIKKVDPKKIAVISFTNKATEELEERIVDDFGIPVNVTTFHALGMKYVRKIIGNAVGIASEYEQKRIIENYIINEVFSDKEKLSFIVQNFSEYFSYEFKEKYKKFNTFEEYFNDYKKRKYEKEKDNIKRFNYHKTMDYLEKDSPISIKGERCKSKGEARIANYLFYNSIDYEYEKIFPEKVDEDRSYSPDFTVEHNGKNIYIEYFGLFSYFENGTISEKNLKKYKRNRNKKLEFFRNKDGIYDLIELDYYDIGDNDEKCYYLGILKKELLKRNIVFKPKTDIEIFNQLIENNKCAEFYKFIDIIIKSITIIKEENLLLDFNKVLSKWIDNNNFEGFEYMKYNNQLEIITDFIRYYQSYIINNHLVDYADMINYAVNYFNRVYDEKGELIYDYIIIDEYQDITLPRYLFTKKISDKNNSKIIAVGDDWQSIFKFTGSDVKLFYNFEDLFPGAEKLTISNTYRNSQQLIDVASNFVLRNPNQIYKNLISNKSLNKPIEVHYFERENEIEYLNELIKQIYNNNPNDKILLLSRRNADIDRLFKTGLFKDGKNGKVICNAIPEANIIALTVHSAKGLGADQVIILNLSDKTFPSHYNKDYWVIKALRPINDEDYPFAEDRRLFYVALTRTKNKVYLLVPNDNPSRFVNEIINEENIFVKENNIKN